MTKYAMDSTSSRVIPLTDESPSWTKHMNQADLVIEAVFEDLGLKHKVIKQVKKKKKKRRMTIDETNTAYTLSLCVSLTNLD